MAKAIKKYQEIWIFLLFFRKFLLVEIVKVEIAIAYRISPQNYLSAGLSQP
ncbi:hypothetical protein [Nostoc cycadae]|uniref:hypothetical protein n=1 Tax=Nostoc cycadae TaxID=246795 RepID=UPI0016517272|nr:hypothetical protein [Nostoc cycadae]